MGFPYFSREAVELGREAEVGDRRKGIRRRMIPTTTAPPSATTSHHPGYTLDTSACNEPEADKSRTVNPTGIRSTQTYLTHFHPINAMPNPRSRTVSVSSSVNKRTHPGHGPPSPTFSDATNASAMNFGSDGPEKIITRADLKASLQAYDDVRIRIPELYLVRKKCLSEPFGGGLA